MATRADLRSDSSSLAFLRFVAGAMLGWPRFVAAFLLAAWALLIWQLSAGRHIRVTGIGFEVPLVRNLAHSFEFGILALLAIPLLPRTNGWPLFRRLESLVLVGACLVYAFVDETHQALVPGRNASILDLVTDLAGILAVVYVARYVATEGSDGNGLWRRLLVGLLGCVAAAAAATLYDDAYGTGPWFPVGS